MIDKTKKLLLASLVYIIQRNFVENEKKAFLLIHLKHFLLKI